MSAAATLARRLRMLATEIESADRYGVPIPSTVSVNGYSNIEGASFAATPEEFDAWADYCVGAVVEEYDHAGKHWRAATADANGLTLRFAVSS